MSCATPGFKTGYTQIKMAIDKVGLRRDKNDEKKKIQKSRLGKTRVARACRCAERLRRGGDVKERAVLKVYQDTENQDTYKTGHRATGCSRRGW